MTQPTRKQIHDRAQIMAARIGGAVHLSTTDLTMAIDGEFPGMTDAEFAAVRGCCVEVANEMHHHALRDMWNPSHKGKLS